MTMGGLVDKLGINLKIPFFWLQKHLFDIVVNRYKNRVNSWIIFIKNFWFLNCFHFRG